MNVLSIETFVAAAGIIIFTMVFIAASMYVRRYAAETTVQKAPVRVNDKANLKPVYGSKS